MSATRSAQAERRSLVFGGWVVFAAASLLSMQLWPFVGVVGFHFVWISLAIVYGIQGWSTRRTAIVLSIVVVLTTAAMADLVREGPEEWPEMSEVPLMAAVFLTMVWHVRRRAAALHATQSAALGERRANQVKELFVRSCSHQMRTPITVARGYAEMVRGVLPDESSKDDVDVVIDELDKLGGLAGRLLVLAEAYEAEEFEWAPVDLGALVQRTVQRWRPTAERAWTVDAPTVLVDADESQLEAALDALTENALKFTVDRDRIALRCRATRSGAVLEVEDSGIGFANSRLDDGSGPPHSSGRPGTGLGLAIVRAVAQGHGGDLVIDEDRSPGALLRLTLPARRANSTEPPPGWEPRASGPTGPIARDEPAGP
jgi:two-component system, OmpR family, sensor kinase